jgi:hypothetical protein
MQSVKKMVLLSLSQYKMLQEKKLEKQNGGGKKIQNEEIFQNKNEDVTQNGGGKEIQNEEIFENNEIENDEKNNDPQN